MIEGLLGRKLGMTQIFDEQGRAVPVTVLEVGPCVVTQVKTVERDGYTAVQLGFGHRKRINKPLAGHLRASGAQPRYLREVRVDDPENFTVGQVITCASVFEAGQLVDVTGWRKGRGFAGVVKRHGFGGGPKTHGQSDRLRAPGSIGPTTTPGRVHKGKRMAGRMGPARVTVQNLRVMRVDAERNLVLVKGAVPGPIKGLVIVRHAIKQRERERAARAKA
ncbi:50S ribosomal protein L3 [Thermorudis peleae]|uniref:50S ribosomal protein L3 n=1 Tax=Thermorudis peleae TaxID=1382356 RepID=UPI00056E1E90|nr:50S ribosomal protein L3 [Thermorudis peleae]MBX6754025.1 50S ribosomal protein L3 [Thermorudis peleae]